MEKEKIFVSKNRPLLFILIAASLINFLEIALLPISDSKVYLSDISFIILNLVTAACLWSAARQVRPVSKKLSTGWYILFAAQLLFAIGEMIWAYYEIRLQENPFPSQADIFFLAYYPAFFIGILLLGEKSESKIQLANHWLDGAIVFLSSGLFIGVYVVSPIIKSVSGGTAWEQILTIAYPIGDLMLLSALLILIYQNINKIQSLPKILIAISLLIQVITDFIFSYQSLNGTYVSGGWLDIGWAMGYFTLGMAGYLQTIKPEKPTSESIKKESKTSKWENLLYFYQTYIPYLLVIAVYLFLIFSYTNHIYANMNHLFGGVGLIILLVLFRQFLASKENERLNLNLNQAIKDVRQKAADAEDLNKELEVEIGERKKAESQLTFTSLHDPLTKLPNRALFMNRLEHSIDYGQRHKNYSFAVFFLDIDHFKNVNDSLGHNAGDELLILFSQRILKQIRKSDTLARFGGDEFALLIEDGSQKSSLTKTAKRIFNCLQNTYKIGQTNFHISASMGIVGFQKEYKNPSDILQDADYAMYRAKELGRARYVFFTPDLRKDAISRLDLEMQMRKGIEKHEFILHYQPIYSLAHKMLIGFEALVRWNHPNQGLLVPADFLSIAEESDIIEKIDDWVLFQACSQMKQWNEQLPKNHGWFVIINVSGRQFKRNDFIELLRKTIEKTGLPSKYICLEITETILISQRANANQVFSQLHEMGVRIHIDDFGTGYSSLNYLKDFPVDTIKIDKSFIHSIDQNEKGFALVKTIFLMAKNLGMEVIAEGIETREQLDSIKSMACLYGQGFYLSHPLPPKELETMMQSEISKIAEGMNG